MRSRRAVHRSGIPTSWALCLFAFCLTPIILDVATCAEVNAGSLHQPALVDRGNIDPSKATPGSSSVDYYISSPILLSSHTDAQKAVSCFDPLGPPRDLAICSLTSRPPPVS